MTHKPSNHKRIQELREACATYRSHHLLAPLSVIGYANDWSLFARWCEDNRLKSMPAKSETLSLYAADMIERGKKVTTVRRNLQGVVERHRIEGKRIPSTVDARSVLSGVQRMHPQRPRQVEPITLRDIERICAACDMKRKWDARDRAIIVAGFASALRRSNLSALDLADIEFAPTGVVLHVRREKQDRQSRGRLIGLPRSKSPYTCPVEALRAWLKHRGHSPGPLFTRATDGGRICSPSIGLIVKKRIASIGGDPKRYGGHSLRAGFVTEAGERGVSELLIASQTGHRSMDVLRRYFRKRDIWKSNAAAMILS